MRGGILHINLHLVLNYIHKYTDIYDSILLLGLKRVVAVERGSTPYPSPDPFLHLLLNCVHKYTNIYYSIGVLAFSGD